MEFFLGTHVLNHLEKTDVPLFISRRGFDKRKSSLDAKGSWSLDSGGFSELRLHGGWTLDASEYVERVNRINKTPNLRWAAQQDWMCEAIMLERTGLTVREHQRRTVDNFLELRSLECDVPIIPVLQGYSMGEYKDCFEMFEASGVDLRSEPVVGLGSVCRRQNTDDIERIVKYFHAKDLRLHGFGVKTLGLKRYGEMLESADSLAWSFGARYSQAHCSIHKENPTTKNCANCLNYALEWRSKIV
tara:strand:+ start:2389 stop:3123 length:735 start_codon:yes stop_codon:yes gene_type:complete